MPELDGYADRIGRLLYANTDEKAQLSDWLTKALDGRRLESALDVGAGPGLISAPLAVAARQLTLVEKDPAYTEVLRVKYPTARVEPVAIQDWDNQGQRFDFILFSHGLYYQPETEWLGLVKRLQGWLRPGGELVVVLNADAGDWWTVVERCHHLRPHWGFFYRPASLFTRELSELGALETESLRCTVTFPDRLQMTELVAVQLMQILDSAVVEANRAHFDAIVDELIARNEGLRLRIDSVIYRLRLT